MEALITNGAQVEACDAAGATALLHALLAPQPDPEVVLVLLAMGGAATLPTQLPLPGAASVQHADWLPQDCTPLHAAALRCALLPAVMLLAWGDSAALVAARDGAGRTALAACECPLTRALMVEAARVFPRVKAACPDWFAPSLGVPPGLRPLYTSCASPFAERHVRDATLADVARRAELQERQHVLLELLRAAGGGTHGERSSLLLLLSVWVEQVETDGEAGGEGVRRSVRLCARDVLHAPWAEYLQLRSDPLHRSLLQGQPLCAAEAGAGADDVGAAMHRAQERFAATRSATLARITTAAKLPPRAASRPALAQAELDHRSRALLSQRLPWLQRVRSAHRRRGGAGRAAPGSDEEEEETAEVAAEEAEGAADEAEDAAAAAEGAAAAAAGADGKPRKRTGDARPGEPALQSDYKARPRHLRAPRTVCDTDRAGCLSAT